MAYNQSPVSLASLIIIIYFQTVEEKDSVCLTAKVIGVPVPEVQWFK